MKRRKLLTVVGSVCLALILLTSLLAGCAPDEEEEVVVTPEEEEEEVVTPEEEEEEEEEEITPAISEEVFEWKMQTSSFPGHAGYMRSEKWVEMIKVATGGRLQITLYPANVICSTMEMFDACAAGILDYSGGSATWIQGKVPCAFIEWGLVGGPAKYLEQVALFWYFQPECFEDVYREALADLGVYLVQDCTQDKWYGQFMSTVPITCPEDLDGLKVRSWGMTGKVWEEYGASLVVTDPGEEYTAIALGTIDCLNRTRYRGFMDLKLHEVCDYIIDGSIGLGGGGTWACPASWNALPPDLQAIVDIQQRYLHQWSMFEGEIDNAEALALMIQEWGLEYTVWPDEMKAPCADIAYGKYREYAEEKDDPYTYRLLNILYDFMKLTGYDVSELEWIKDATW